MVIVDTTVWVDYLRGTDTPHTAWLDREIERRRLGSTDLILCEVLQGVSDERTALATRREMLKFEIFATGGVELATSAALTYRTLRARGFTIRRTLDCLIATFCINNQHALLHSDRDFDPFDPFERELGLQVVHPAPRSASVTWTLLLTRFERLFESLPDMQCRYNYDAVEAA